MSYELDVMATEYVESEIPIPAGDQSRDGLVRPVNSNTILKGRLHLRLANIGHPADPSLTRTGLSCCHGNIFSSFSNRSEFIRGKLH